MSTMLAALLVALNLGLIFLLLAVPLGVRTVRLERTIRAGRNRVWQAVWPLGSEARWSGEIVDAEPLDGKPGLARLTLGWEGRDSQPIRRSVHLTEVVEGKRFTMRVIDDSSLDPAFWADYVEAVELDGDNTATTVTLTRTDRYRGLAILVFRYFTLRRQLGKLKDWAETGRYRAGGFFEHPASQVGFAIISVLLLWPLFGLNIGGFVLAAVLTFVVALHELGHMAAFRLMGHRRVRMIFVPLLGGIAIGGRPYDSHFEVAFVALMGAGFSAFIVPPAIAGSVYAAGEGWIALAALLATLAGCAAFFNIANLVPIWKFDGGQVLRQICPNGATLALASFLLLSMALWVGHAAGFSTRLLVIAGAIVAILSVMTASSGVKPRHDLKPIAAFDRFALGAALLAAFTVHGYGVLWAAAQIARYNERMAVLAGA